MLRRVSISVPRSLPSSAAPAVPRRAQECLALDKRTSRIFKASTSNRTQSHLPKPPTPSAPLSSFVSSSIAGKLPKPALQSASMHPKKPPLPLLPIGSILHLKHSKTSEQAQSPKTPTSTESQRIESDSPIPETAAPADPKLDEAASIHTEPPQIETLPEQSLQDPLEPTTASPDPSPSVDAKPALETAGTPRAPLSGPQSPSSTSEKPSLDRPVSPFRPESPRAAETAEESSTSPTRAPEEEPLPEAEPLHHPLPPPESEEEAESSSQEDPFSGSQQPHLEQTKQEEKGHSEPPPHGDPSPSESEALKLAPSSPPPEHEVTNNDSPSHVPGSEPHGAKEPETNPMTPPSSRANSSIPLTKNNTQTFPPPHSEAVETESPAPAKRRLTLSELHQCYLKAKKIYDTRIAKQKAKATSAKKQRPQFTASPASAYRATRTFFHSAGPPTRKALSARRVKRKAAIRFTPLDQQINISHPISHSPKKQPLKTRKSFAELKNEIHENRELGL